LLSDDPLLVAVRNRHAYFFLDAWTYRGDLSWDIITGREVYVVGDEE
jgi:hypothetical protein